MSAPVDLATAEEFHAEIARLHAEINRLRLTDAEREAIWFAIAYAQNAGHGCEASLRCLLERMSPPAT